MERVLPIRYGRKSLVSEAEVLQAEAQVPLYLESELSTESEPEWYTVYDPVGITDPMRFLVEAEPSSEEGAYLAAYKEEDGDRAERDLEVIQIYVRLRNQHQGDTCPLV